MTQDEKRTTGEAHHKDPLPNDYNPVQYSRYYWLKVYLILTGGAVLLYALVVCLFN